MENSILKQDYEAEQAVFHAIPQPRPAATFLSRKQPVTHTGSLPNK